MLPVVLPVTSHTKYVGVGTTFVVVQGQKENGINYILTALNQGATTIVLEEEQILSDDVAYAIAHHGAEVIYVENARKALAQLSAQAHDYPARKLKIIAVTGTKGKTTTSWMLAHIFKHAGYKTALLSTVRNRILDTELATELTTPQPDYIHAFLNTCVEQGVEWVIMEVAAQATSLHRTEGIEFDGALFTNFSPTHAEFYAQVDDYFAAKHQILKQVKSGSPIILNGDDERVKQLSSQFENAQCIYKDDEEENAITYRILSSLKGLDWWYSSQGQQEVFHSPHLIGSFNVFNASAATALAQHKGIALPVIKQALIDFAGVPGRLEAYALPNGARCYIDYAHTPSSFAAVLSLLREVTDNLIVVFGAGGDRDRTMRPELGAIASAIANYIVLTTDNPRSEQVEDITADILAGVDPQHTYKICVEYDREAAIKKAYSLSTERAIVVLLGKGPDEYQIIGTQKTYFSERAIIKQLS
ncbi:UDP-N-acetylmuramoyl-L-alanyl-D-glutamate--2,6-diaminopimelate ligase [Candidatus Dependentiae bacterium Noda2021]|nr:UDP-N-acetylmuramoyl-L-alanyl-D-glutamate--2,6-diaminopimelate ligase [Candidatus Dependentiae bacterium Noda2021]